MTAFRHYRWVLLAGCALFFLARWAFLQTRFERLADLPADELLAIRNGSAYFRVRYPQDFQQAPPPQTRKREPAVIRWDYAPTPLTIRTTPVAGGHRRLLGEDKRSKMNFVLPRFTDSGITYLACTREQTRTLPARLALPGMLRRAGGRLTYIQAQLYTVPLSGGSPVAVAPTLRLHTIIHPAFPLPPYAVVGDAIFWLEADLDADLMPRNARRNAGGYITDAPLRLLKASLTGGAPTVMAVGLPKETGLHATSQAVWWMIPSKEADQGPDIYCLRGKDTKPQCILRNMVNREFPLEVNGRLYWRRDRSHDPEWNSGGSLLPALQSEIVSAALDGSDARVVFTDTESPFPIALHTHAGKLYFSQVEKTAPNRSDFSLRIALYRLEPDVSDGKKRLLLLPRDGLLSRFDGDYVYFILVEQRENVFDWSHEGLRPTFVPVLYRSRLPD